MTIQTKVHDGAIALLNVVSLVLAVTLSLWFLALAGLVALVMLSSLITGFCPIHWTVGKLFPVEKKQA